jgi:hypothetical protein
MTNVGQTRATTVRGPARRGVAAASTYAKEPSGSGWRREGRSIANRWARSSIFTPGPAGFGSARTTRARLARYGPAAVLETLKAMRSPGVAESRSV